MADTIAHDDKRTRLNSVHGSPAKVLTPVNPSELVGFVESDADVLSLIVVAIRRSGVKQEFLASLSNVKASQLSAALNGHGAFNVRWLWSWPPEFWGEFIPVLRAHKEQSPEAHRAHRKELLVHAIELLLTEVA